MRFTAAQVREGAAHGLLRLSSGAAYGRDGTGGVAQAIKYTSPAYHSDDRFTIAMCHAALRRLKQQQQQQSKQGGGERLSSWLAARLGSAEVLATLEQLTQAAEVKESWLQGKCDLSSGGVEWDEQAGWSG